MKRFKSVLVAVDVLHPGFDAGSQLPVEVASVIEGATRVHDHSEGRLTLQTVVAPSSGADVDELVDEAARRRLQDQVEPLLGDREHALVVSRGTAFVEIIREVMRGEHDLLVVSAAPDSEGPQILGGTTTQLMRKCPCPVWVVPRRIKAAGPRIVLSAVALHELSSQVAELSAGIVSQSGGEWHVIHVPEYPLEGGMRLRGASSEEILAYEKQCREQAYAALHEIVDPLAAATGVAPKLWMAEGRPSEKIAEAEEQLGADLVVLGTVSQAGLAGLLIGRTAERVLARVESSVLAVKPKGFVSPVSLTD